MHKKKRKLPTDRVVSIYLEYLKEEVQEIYSDDLKLMDNTLVKLYRLADELADNPRRAVHIADKLVSIASFVNMDVSLDMNEPISTDTYLSKSGRYIKTTF